LGQPILYFRYHQISRRVRRARRYVVVDNDCIWIRSIAEIDEAIGENGVLTYFIDGKEHPEDEASNGLSRQGMARFLLGVEGKSRESIPYCGGEIFAANLLEIKRLAGDR
jgi:hypothetical protein